MRSKVRTISGDLAVDERGTVRFVNDFNFAKVKRFYQVENFDEETIRAFHGHLKEAKYVYVAAGSALVCVVRMTDKKKPDKSQKVERYVLSAKKPLVLFIPAGYANGFRALESGTKVIFFSTLSLDQSRRDDYRFPYNYWGKDVWQVENR